MVDSQGHAVIWSIFGLVGGLIFFFRGLRYYRKTLVVADTPAIPIRSVAMGLAQVHGTAQQGEGAFPSPVSGLPCYAYKVVIERYDRHSDSGGWSHYRTDVNGKWFYLEDDTGRVEVDPYGADLDVPRTCLRTVPQTTWSMWTDKEADFPATAAAKGLTVRSDEDLQEFAQGLGGDYNNRYRFTEYCVLPGKEYDVLGTCVENPRPNGPNDHNLITKGKNEETFLITSKAPAQLERSLSWKSALMVWGGIALAGACAALLLAEFGLL